MPGVDLVAVEFVARRVVRLDDPLDRPELAADDPAEPRRVGREDARERDGRVVLATRLEDRVEVGAGHQRHVARQDEDLGRLGRDRRRGPRGPRRPCRGACPGARTCRASAKTSTIGLDRRRVDDDRASGRGAIGRALPGVEDVVEHRTAAQTVEDLGRRRAHPGPESGRQHDGDRAGRRGGTWGVHEVRRRPADGRGRRAHRTRSGSGARSSGFIKGPGIVGAARSECQPRRHPTGGVRWLPRQPPFRAQVQGMRRGVVDVRRRAGGACEHRRSPGAR